MTPGVAKWISLACIIFGLLGWSAIVLVAKIYPGGHPPLVAYVAINANQCPLFYSSFGIGPVQIVSRNPKLTSANRPSLRNFLPSFGCYPKIRMSSDRLKQTCLNQNRH